MCRGVNVAREARVTHAPMLAVEQNTSAARIFERSTLLVDIVTLAHI